MTMVWPSSSTARRMKARISPPLRESRLPVGSSAKITDGRVARARATATRCCWPPDSSAGRCFSRSPRPTVSTTPWIQRLSGFRPDRSSGRVMFSPALNIGSRLNAWNTKPTWSRRSRVSCFSDSRPSSTSPMNTRPDVSVSSPARQCMRVDLPDPEGPMMAVKRPAGRARLTPSRARTAVSPSPHPFPACSVRTAMGAGDAPSPAVVLVITSFAVIALRSCCSAAGRSGLARSLAPSGTLAQGSPLLLLRSGPLGPRSLSRPFGDARSGLSALAAPQRTARASLALSPLRGRSLRSPTVRMGARSVNGAPRRLPGGASPTLRVAPTGRSIAPPRTRLSAAAPYQADDPCPSLANVKLPSGRALARSLAAALALAGLGSMLGPTPAAAAPPEPDPAAPAELATVPPTNAFPVPAPYKASFSDDWHACRDGCRRQHKGNDVFADEATPIVAVEPGVIAKVDGTDDSNGGLSIWLLGDSGVAYWYAHNSANYVTVGQRVGRGQLIRRGGAPGNARTPPPHIHLQVNRCGELNSAEPCTANPFEFLSRWTPGQIGGGADALGLYRRAAAGTKLRSEGGSGPPAFRSPGGAQ